MILAPFPNTLITGFVMVMVTWRCELESVESGVPRWGRVSEAGCKYSFFQLLTHIFKALCVFLKALHTNSTIAHTKCKKRPRSCKIKHSIQNILSTSQKQAFVSHHKHISHNITYLCISFTHRCSKSKTLLFFMYCHTRVNILCI